MNNKIINLSIVVILIIAIAIIPSMSYAINEDVTLEKVKEDICEIELGEDGKVTKQLISVEDASKEIVLQIDVENLKSKELIMEPSEIFLVVDNSRSMTENSLSDGTTRKEAVFTAAKELALKLLTAQSNTQIGVVSFSTNSDISKEGTIEDANLVLAPTNQISQINSAIDGIQTTGARTNIDAGLQTASQNFTINTDLNQYLILLTDGVPNTAVGGPTMTYSGEVTTKTRQTLQSVIAKGINIITVMTGVNSTYQPDATGTTSPEAANKTYQELAQEIFGTQATPTYGKFYYVTDENVENIITDAVYTDVFHVKTNEITDITVIDYFPEEIIENYDFEILEEPNIGTVQAQISTTNNSITWTISNLPAGQKASFKYKLTLKENFNREIIDIETPTNEKVDVTYKDTVGTEKQQTSDKSPSVILKVKDEDNTIANTEIPQTGDNIPYVTIAVIAVIALIIVTGINKNKLK